MPLLPFIIGASIGASFFIPALIPVFLIMFVMIGVMSVSTKISEVRWRHKHNAFLKQSRTLG